MRRKPFLGALVVKAARKYYCHADSAQSRMFRRRDDDGSLVGLILRLPSARSPHDVDTRDVGSLGSRRLVHSAALKSRSNPRLDPANLQQRFESRRQVGNADRLQTARSLGRTTT